MESRFVSAIVFLSFAACAYVMPASWRSFHSDPDDAGSAITRALESKRFEISELKLADRRIVTGWTLAGDMMTKKRERFVITWERDTTDGGLTIYVRHQAQDQDHQDEGRRTWGTMYHETSREEMLLDLIARELALVHNPASAPPTAPEETESGPGI